MFTQRANGLYSRYSYDAGGRLRELRHHDRNKTLARFLYAVDHRGNRTQAFEELARPSTIVQTIGISDGAVSYYKGTWNTSGSYKATSEFSSAMTITFTGKETALTLGTGTDHSIFDIYIDGSLWESFDGYSTSGIDRTINISLDRGGSHTIDIQNRAEKNKNSSGYNLRFKQLVILSTTYDIQTIDYGYDALARLLTANYTGLMPTRSYTYAFDRSGNRTQQIVNIGGTPTTMNYTYNGANQLISDGVHTLTYDNNGNLTNDGTSAHTWNRANRLASLGGTSYLYDGEGHRVQQTVGATVTKYLLDLQPGLSVVLSETTGANTTRYVHSSRGIHAIKDSSAAWHWITQDGLGTVRGVVDNVVAAQESRMYGAYGDLYAQNGTTQTSYGFTGEYTDPTTQLVHLRARDYSPTLGVFTRLDPFEGLWDAPMSINRYGYVGDNPVNRVDLSGMCWANPSVPTNQQDVCYDAWLQYTNLITQTYTQSWPQDVSILVSQEARYWGNLSYIDFVNGWNSSRPAASTDPGGQVLSAGLPGALLISQADSPLPGPADILTAIGVVCVVGLAVIANSGAITLPLRPGYDFSAAGAAGATITLSTFQAMIREASPSKGGRKFDLALGKEIPDLIPFALSFGFKPITLPYLYWPDWMTTDIGQSTSRTLFKTAFDPILAAYFSQIPNGKLKLNLSGLDSSQPYALTTFEVWKLSTTYAAKSEYYKFENFVHTELSPTEAAPIIAEILSTFSPSLQP